MFFRNLTFFRFPDSVTFKSLQEKLTDNALKPVGALELSSSGFISPFGQDSEVFEHRVGDAIWLTLGTEEKILPSTVINDQLQKKLAAIEEKEGRKVTGGARKRLKDDLIHELLPRAFARPKRTDIMLDLEHGLCIIDTSSRNTAEAAVSAIRQALGSFPAVPVNAEVAPRSILTGWVAGHPLPKNFELGDECELQDPGESGATVKCQRQLLDSEEIKQHLEAGKQATRVGVRFDHHLSFVCSEDLVIRKLKFLEGAVEQLESTEREDIRAELDARFALMSAEIKRLFPALEKAFKLSKV